MQAPHIDDEILDGKARLGTLLDLDSILILVAEKHVGNVPSGQLLLDAHNTGIHTRFDHVRLDHAHCLITHLVRLDGNPPVGVARQDARDKLRAELPRGREARWVGVGALEGGREDDLERGEEERVDMSLVQHFAALLALLTRRVGCEIRVQHAYHCETTLFGERLDARLVFPGEPYRHPVRQGLLRGLVDRLDDRLDSHGHFIVWLVAAQHVAKPLRARFPPKAEEAVDQVGLRKFDMVHHAVGLPRECHGRRLALGADPRGPRCVRVGRARDRDGVRWIGEGRDVRCRLGREGGRRVGFAQVGVEREVLDGVFILVVGVEGLVLSGQRTFHYRARTSETDLEGHAIIAHGLGSTHAAAIAFFALDLPAPRLPVLVHCFLSVSCELPKLLPALDPLDDTGSGNGEKRRLCLDDFTAERGRSSRRSWDWPRSCWRSRVGGKEQVAMAGMAQKVRSHARSANA